MQNIFVLTLLLCLLVSCNNPNSTQFKDAQVEKTIPSWITAGDEEVLDSISRHTFRYFYDFSHPVSGMGKERSHSPKHGVRSANYDVDETVTTGGTGFGIMAFPVAVERGWISREAAVDHVLKVTTWLLEDAERFHGMFSHWYEGSTGKAFAFSAKDNGGDIVESAFMFQALISLRQYFDQENPAETQVRKNITQLWKEADWDFYRNDNPWILWHWSPEFGFEKNMTVMGFDETQIVYILAAASPTHPIDPSIYDSGWAIDYNNRFRRAGDYVQRLKIREREDLGGPLFFTHYSYLGMPPYFKDKYIEKAGYADYFEHHRDMALAQVEYCLDAGYPEHCWGLTSSDDHTGYSAHAPGPIDNGTITLTAAISSIPYTPEESKEAIYYFLENHYDSLYGPYGFHDAFNLKEDYFAPSYLAIDQGPIPVMIENYRTGLLWKYFLRDPDVQNGLEKLGFTLTKTFEHDKQ